MHLYLAGCSCHLHFWQNARDLLHATRGWNRYRDLSTKSYPEEENYPAAPAGTLTRNLSITSPALYKWAIPSPICSRISPTGDIILLYCVTECFSCHYAHGHHLHVTDGHTILYVLLSCNWLTHYTVCTTVIWLTDAPYCMYYCHVTDAPYCMYYCNVTDWRTILYVLLSCNWQTHHTICTTVM